MSFSPIIKVGGVLAFVLICLLVAMQLELISDSAESNEFTDNIVKPTGKTLDKWSGKFQVIGWTAFISFITTIIPRVPWKIKGGAVLFVVLGGIVAWFLG